MITKKNNTETFYFFANCCDITFMARCFSCHPSNSVNAMKDEKNKKIYVNFYTNLFYFVNSVKSAEDAHYKKLYGQLVIINNYILCITIYQVNNQL